MHFEPRAKVAKDQSLFIIDPSEYQAKYDQTCAAVEGEKARYDLATYAAGRTVELYAKDSAAE